MFRNKRFRSALCILLSFLTLVHTTPLYAAVEVGEVTQSGELQPAGSSPQDPGAQPETPESPDPPESPGEMPSAASEENPNDKGNDIAQQAPDSNLSTGAAGYSVPLATPPGRQGIAPNLSLTYNSYRQNGWIGPGFGLDLGAIQRSTKRGLNYAANDYVATINGASSELKPRTEWGTNYYGNRIEGAFLKYYFNPSTKGWEVKDKSGTTYYYGSTPASRLQKSGTEIWKWLLSRVQDVHGNYMEVSYQSHDGELYLHEIKYTGHAPKALPTNRVMFSLEERPDVMVSWASGAEVRTAYRLKSIYLEANGQQAGSYVLNYAISPTSGRSLLQSVTRYGSDGATALPPVSFEWQTSSPGFRDGKNLGARQFGRSVTFGQFADITGDGLADFVYETNPDILSTGINRMLNIDGLLEDEGLLGRRLAEYNPKFKGFYLADIDGDGFQDIIYDDKDKKIHVLKNNSGAGFLADTVKADRIATPECPIRVADVNGDGNADLVYSISTNNLFRLLLADGSGGFLQDHPAGTRSEYYLNNESATFRTGDVNGDGKADILYRSYDKYHVLLSNGDSFGADTVWLSPSQLPVNCARKFFSLADVNADGLADLVFVGTDDTGYGAVRVALSNGRNGFSPDTSWGRISDSFSHNTTLADLNSDGLPDLLVDTYGPDGKKHVYVYINTGTAFIDTGSWGSYNGYSYEGFSMVDMNGDGLPDFTLEKHNETATTSLLWTLLSKIPVPDVISRINNGMGGSHSLTYRPSSRCANTRLPFVLQTVSSITSDDGNGNVSTIRYTYSDGLYSYAEREFMGFGKAVRTLPDSSRVESFMRQDFAGKGLVTDQKIYDPAGELNRHTHNTYAVVSPFSGSYFPRLDATELAIYDGAYTPQRIMTTFEYDNYGNVQWKNSLGDTALTGDERHDYIEYAYDVSKWLLARPLSLITRAARDSQTALTKTTMEYYPGTNLVKTKKFYPDTTVEEGPVISYTYDDYGNVLSQTDPKGNTTQTVYDPTNTYAQMVTNALDHSATVYYDYRYGKPTRKIDPNENEVSCEYDALGRPLKVIGPNDSAAYPTTTYSYNSFGTVGSQNIRVGARKVSGAAGVYYKLSYFDGFGREIKTRADGPAGKYIYAETRYDLNGRVSAKSLPYFGGGEKRWVETTYDFLGRPVEKKNPDATKTTITYYKGRTTYVDPRNANRMEDRDVYGRIKKVWEYTSDTYRFATSYNYDPLGNLTEIIDSTGASQGTTTTIIYDALSRKKEMRDKDMGTWTYEYDLNGNLEKQIDANLNAIIFQYDALNRLKKKDFPTGTDTVYAYDDPACGEAIGRLSKVTDSSGLTVLYYDNEGRVYRTRKLIDGVNYNIYHTYDALGRVKSVKYPDNETVAYTYDTGGNLSAVGGYATFPDAAYDALGQPGRISYGNGVLTTLLYNDSSNSRLSEISTTSPVDGLLQHYGYSYDENGNITAIADSVDPAKNQGFQYDLLNRMTQATTGNSPPIDLTYSRTGNIVTNTRVGTSTWVYDTPAHPSAVKTAGTNSYTYDANGNMWTRNGAVLDYDYENRLIRITKGGAVNTYVYDYTGARIKKTTPTSATIYIGNLYEVKDGVATKHIFAGGRRIASKTGSSIYYFHPDHLGGLNVVTDNDGRNVQSNTYYPFGETRYTTGSDILQYKFTGQENDPESGLYYYGARFYDPVIGRFITPDSIVQSPGDPQSLNRYTYCRNNPVLFTDPTGHFINFFFALMIGIGLGAATSAIMGGDISAGAALGGLSAGLFFGAGEIAGAIAQSLTSVTAASMAHTGLHIAAGMGTGALNGAVTHQDILKGAAIGGISAGVAKAFGGLLHGTDWFKNLDQSGQIAAGFASHTAIGAVTGGMTSELFGGSFGQGATQGAMTAGYGYTFNYLLHLLIVGGIIYDIYKNTSIADNPNNENLTVDIPPPSMFKEGFPMPFFFGVKTDVQPYQLPFNIPFFGDTVGIPNNLQITVDPIFNRFLYPNQQN